MQIARVVSNTSLGKVVYYELIVPGHRDELGLCSAIIQLAEIAPFCKAVREHRAFEFADSSRMKWQDDCALFRGGKMWTWQLGYAHCDMPTLYKIIDGFESKKAIIGERIAELRLERYIAKYINNRRVVKRQRTIGHSKLRVTRR